MIETISIDITYDCNLRCLHCFNSSGEHGDRRKIMSDEEIFNIVKDIVKLKPKSLCFCGGETMIRKDLIIKCCKYINKILGKKISVAAVSNGLLMNDLLAKELKAAGMNSIQISLDGAKAETHDWLRNKRGAFDKAVNAIKILKANKLNVGVAFTPTKKNISELNDAFEFAKSMGVFTFRVQPIMLLGRAKRNLYNYIPSYTEYMKLRFNLLTKQKEELNKSVHIEWGDPLMHLVKGRSKNEPLDYLTINGYGDLLVSPYMPVSVGNIRQTSIFKYIDAGLLSIWQNDFIQKLALKMDSWDNMDLSKFGFPEIFLEDNINMDILKEDSKMVLQKYQQLL